MKKILLYINKNVINKKNIKYILLYGIFVSLIVFYVYKNENRKLKINKESKKLELKKQENELNLFNKEKEIINVDVLFKDKFESKYKDYYFAGEIDINKYFTNILEYQKKDGISFEIYNNMIFAKLNGDYDELVSLKFNDGEYELTTNDKIKLLVNVKDGLVKDMKILNPGAIKNKKKLTLDNDSCKIADFIFYYLDTLNGYSKTNNYKIYRLGEYNKNRYLFDFWFVEVAIYKNRLLSGYSCHNGRIKQNFRKICYRKANLNKMDKYYKEEQLIVVKDCKDINNEETDFVTENCIYQKYDGKLINNN